MDFVKWFFDTKRFGYTAEITSKRFGNFAIYD